MRSRMKASPPRILGGCLLSACIAAVLAGCIGGSGDKAPVPDNIKPVYGPNTPPPPLKKGVPAPSSSAPAGNGTTTNPSGYIPQKK